MARKYGEFSETKFGEVWLVTTVNSNVKNLDYHHFGYFILIYISLMSACLVSTVQGNSCPLAADELEMYTMTCHGTMRTGITSFQWKLVYPSGSAISISCNDKTQSCDNLVGKNINATYARRQNGDVISQLTINQVTYKERDVKITCGQSNETGRKIKDILACTLDVYHSPANVTCVASQEVGGSNDITLICNVPRVYPKLSHCKVLQHAQSDGVHRPVADATSDSVAVYKTPTRYISTTLDRGYFRATCVMEVFVPNPGQYSYAVDISTNISSNPFQVSSTVAISEIITVDSPGRMVRIKTLPEYLLDLCIVNKVLPITCEAYGFSEVPRFFWTVSDEFIKQNVSHLDKIIEGDHIFYRASVNVRIDQNTNFAKIRCAVSESTGSKPLIKVQDVYVLRLRWPPAQHPVFLDSVGSIKENTMNISNTKLLKMACQIKRGHPQVRSTTVICLAFGSDKESYNFTGRGNKVKFSLSFGHIRSFQCTCSAVHVTGCYHKEVKLAINSADNTAEDLASKKI